MTRRMALTGLAFGARARTHADVVEKNIITQKHERLTLDSLRPFEQGRDLGVVMLVYRRPF